MARFGIAMFYVVMAAIWLAALWFLFVTFGNGAFSQFVRLSGGQARIIDQWHNFLSGAIGVSPMVSSTIR